MATIINADTSDGLKLTSDTSGEIQFQSNGVTKMTVSSTGITGAGRSGVTPVNLSSGTPNVSLTASDGQTVVISSDATGRSVTMPDCTTISPTGSNYFVLYNTSSYAVFIKSSDGTIRDILPASTIQSWQLTNNSTAVGIWSVNASPIAGESVPNNIESMAGLTISTLSWVGGTTFIQIGYTPTSNAATTIYARTVTVDTTTKVLTYGTTTSLGVFGATNVGVYYNQVWSQSNGVDRGIISIGMYCNAVVPVINYALGYAIVAGSIYISARTATVTSSTNIGVAYAGALIYLSNDTFFTYTIGSSGYGSGAGTKETGVRMYKVNVSGTTVTLAAGTGNTEFASVGTSITQNGGYPPPVAQTSPTTFVLDIVDAHTGVFSSGRSLSCNASTNTLTITTRTTQNTKMVNNKITETDGYFDNLVRGSFAFTSSNNAFVSNSDDSVVYGSNWITAVDNVGLATVTAANATTIQFKPYASGSYNTYAAGQNELGNNGSVTVLAADNVLIIDDTKFWSFDPTTTTLNINQAACSLYERNYYMGSSLIFTVNEVTAGSTLYDVTTIANPIKA